MKRWVASVMAMVLLMVSIPFSASAVSDPYNLLKGMREDRQATVEYNKDAGEVTINALEPYNQKNDQASGAVFETWVDNVDLTKLPYLHIVLSSSVPFRFYISDYDCWIFGFDFYAEFVPDGCDEPTMPEDGFYQAGDYHCTINLKNLYEWHASFDGWDPTNANISQVFFQLKEVGSMTLSHLALSSSPVCECELPLAEEKPALAGLEYELYEDGTAQVVGYKGVSYAVVIPPVVDGHTVTSIADNAFSNSVYNIGLIIPKTVTTIGDNVLSKTYYIGYGGTAEEWKAITIGKQTDNWYQNPRYYQCCDAFQGGIFITL